MTHLSKQKILMRKWVYGIDGDVKAKYLAILIAQMVI